MSTPDRLSGRSSPDRRPAVARRGARPGRFAAVGLGSGTASLDPHSNWRMSVIGHPRRSAAAFFLRRGLNETQAFEQEKNAEEREQPALAAEGHLGASGLRAAGHRAHHRRYDPLLHVGHRGPDLCDRGQGPRLHCRSVGERGRQHGLHRRPVGGRRNLRPARAALPRVRLRRRSGTPQLSAELAHTGSGVAARSRDGDRAHFHGVRHLDPSRPVRRDVSHPRTGVGDGGPVLHRRRPLRRYRAVPPDVWLASRDAAWLFIVYSIALLVVVGVVMFFTPETRGRKLE
jgi:hypothetical protein